MNVLSHSNVSTETVHQPNSLLHVFFFPPLPYSSNGSMKWILHYFLLSGVSSSVRSSILSLNPSLRLASTLSSDSPHLSQDVCVHTILRISISCTITHRLRSAQHLFVPELIPHGYLPYFHQQTPIFFI